jgi:hypothetical protein
MAESYITRKGGGGAEEVLFKDNTNTFYDTKLTLLAANITHNFYSVGIAPTNKTSNSFYEYTGAVGAPSPALSYTTIGHITKVPLGTDAFSNTNSQTGGTSGQFVEDAFDTNFVYAVRYTDLNQQTLIQKLHKSNLEVHNSILLNNQQYIGQGDPTQKLAVDNNHIYTLHQNISNGHSFVQKRWKNNFTLVGNYLPINQFASETQWRGIWYDSNFNQTDGLFIYRETTNPSSFTAFETNLGRYNPITFTALNSIRQFNRIRQIDFNHPSTIVAFLSQYNGSTGPRQSFVSIGKGLTGISYLSNLDTQALGGSGNGQLFFFLKNNNTVVGSFTRGFGVYRYIERSLINGQEITNKVIDNNVMNFGFGDSSIFDNWLRYLYNFNESTQHLTFGGTNGGFAALQTINIAYINNNIANGNSVISSWGSLSSTGRLVYLKDIPNTVAVWGERNTFVLNDTSKQLSGFAGGYYWSNYTQNISNATVNFAAFSSNFYIKLPLGNSHVYHRMNQAFSNAYDYIINNNSLVVPR